MKIVAGACPLAFRLRVYNGNTGEQMKYVYSLDTETGEYYEYRNVPGSQRFDSRPRWTRARSIVVNEQDEIAIITPQP